MLWGGHEQCGALTAHALLEQTDDVIPGFGIEIAGWFVGDDQIRRVYDRPSDGCALLFAAGDLIGHTLGDRLEPQRCEHRVYPR